MAILVDDAVWPWRDRLWCHLVSDTSLEELHAFARWIGVPERGFQGDHYDIPAEARQVALDEGARAVSSREIVQALRAAGLRKRRRAVTLGGRRPSLPPVLQDLPDDRQDADDHDQDQDELDVLLDELDVPEEVAGDRH